MFPLQDHFHPPLSIRRHWHAFHNAWATYIASDLNRRLPEGYFAEPNVQFGIEIDVAAFEAAEEVEGVGGVLPILPLWLRGEICLPVDLAETYERTCREQRIVSAE
jgi:hypothetical protein